MSPCAGGMQITTNRPRSLCALACAILLFFHGAPFASETVPLVKVEQSAEQKDIDTIAAWIVRHNGSHKLSLRGDVAKVLGLSNNTKDLSGIGVSFSIPGALHLVLVLYPGHPEMLMAYGNDKEGVYWLIKDGMLAKTAYLVADRVKVIPNDKYLEDYTKGLNFFLGKATGTDPKP